MSTEMDGTGRGPACAAGGCRNVRVPASDLCFVHQDGDRTGQSALICPHCQIAGRVTARPVRLKKGVSGAKATGAVLTLGWSMLATGLSRKEDHTEMSCGACSTVWTV